MLPISDTVLSPQSSTCPPRRDHGPATSQHRMVHDKGEEDRKKAYGRITPAAQRSVSRSRQQQSYQAPTREGSFHNARTVHHEAGAYNRGRSERLDAPDDWPLGRGNSHGKVSAALSGSTGKVVASATIASSYPPITKYPVPLNIFPFREETQLSTQLSASLVFTPQATNINASLTPKQRSANSREVHVAARNSELQPAFSDITTPHHSSATHNIKRGAMTTKSYRGRLLTVEDHTHIITTGLQGLFQEIALGIGCSFEEVERAWEACGSLGETQAMLRRVYEAKKREGGQN